MATSNDLLPTPQYKPKVALEDTAYGIPTYELAIQSAQLLNRYYGEEIDHDLLQLDAFYAFSGIFRFCAFSEVHFLNLMEGQLECWRAEQYDIPSDLYLPSHRQDLSEKSRRADADIVDMSMGIASPQSINEVRMLIDNHAERLRGTLDVINKRGSPHWPKCAHHEVDAVGRGLETDFQYLLLRAKRLSTQSAALADSVHKHHMLKNQEAMIEELRRSAAYGSAAPNKSRGASEFRSRRGAPKKWVKFFCCVDSSYDP